MITNYLLYLNTLPEAEKNEKLFLLLLFFIIVFSVSSILALLKLQFLNENKNSLFQKFLKHI